MASPSRQTLPDSGPSELRIKDVIVHKLRLPYRSVVNFRSVTQDRGEYVLIRILADNGQEGIAEAVCRPEQHGEDATAVAMSIDTLFKPRLIGLDPLAHLSALAAIGRVKFCRTEKALIDIALWDLKGKILKSAGMAAARCRDAKAGAAHLAGTRQNQPGGDGAGCAAAARAAWL